MTETHTNQTIQQVLAIVRQDLEGVSYLPSPREYPCDRGTLLVANAPESGGGRLLGVFRARLVGPSGATLRTYSV